MSDSPAKKKLDFSEPNKENWDVAVPVAGIPLLEPTKEEQKAAPMVAPAIKPEEAHEILLQENPHRFVLFPIQHHEVTKLQSSRPDASCFVPDAPS
jgi:ribonucleoside-diphosphate reductase subunit M2